MNNFDPNSVALRGNNIFGLPFNVKNARIVIIPVPWEVTVSYSTGTAKGPESVFNGSMQVDLFDHDIKDAWKNGIAMDEIPAKWVSKNNLLRKKTGKYIDFLASGEKLTAEMLGVQKEINEAGLELKNWVKSKSYAILNAGKFPVILGGEHSVPLGLIEALTDKYSHFSILQIDAHADLRKAYEGFEYSHASIMYNAMQFKHVEKLVQIGIRDYCEEEAEMTAGSENRIICHYDHEIKKKLFNGKSWNEQCEQMIGELTDHVYISFDIDGLDPSLCPGTGTPVPGGLQFSEAIYLLEKLTLSGKKIIGFDLCEVGAGEWDGNVGARILYKASNCIAKSFL